MKLFKKMLGYDEEIANASARKIAAKKVQFLDKDNITNLYTIADYLKKDYPVIANFEGIDIVQANQIITFTSGLIYGLDGESKKLRGSIYSFATKDQLEDGSFKDLLNNVGDI